MLSITPDQFKRKIAKNQTALKALQDKKLPEIIGCIALKRFEENFKTNRQGGCDLVYSWNVNFQWNS